MFYVRGVVIVLLVGLAPFTTRGESRTNVFSLRDPAPVNYRVIPSSDNRIAGHLERDTIKVEKVDGSGRVLELGNRVTLQVRPGVNIQRILEGHPVRLVRTVAEGVHVLEAADASTALAEAQELSKSPDVLVSHPVQRRPQLRKHGSYAPKPTDTYFTNQWNLENRDINGRSLGLDLNVRAAWPITRGAGTIIAVVDDGVELTHPEFSRNATNGLHFNFTNGTTNSMPVDVDDNHSTALAGLALAQGNNHRGISGVAPAAGLASWKIFNGDIFDITDEDAMDMFQYRSNVVAVQNHSWGNADVSLLGPTLLESIGVSNAVAFGQNGRGVLMVRSGGNSRDAAANVNDDGYASDPRVVAVASVRTDGRATDYSNPGACLLVAAPGGDTDASVIMTDRQGTAGYNTGVYTNDFADYVNSPLIIGTSFSAPQISGLAALIRSANTNLTYRDVQQILLLSARHFGSGDPDRRTNGAGLLVSHNDGFGVPDAGRAVQLARRWNNRPPFVTKTFSANNAQAIPDDGLRVITTGSGIPITLQSIPSAPGGGPHADAPTAVVPIVDVGTAAGPISTDLRGKAALIQQDGVVEFSVKVENAAQAGAVFAIVYHGTSGGQRYPMGGTDFSRIPSVMIDNSPGTVLRTFANQNSSTRVQLQLSAVNYTFNVSDTLLCEHVGVRIRANHTRRGDLRITVLSPRGTRSVLQAANLDDSAGPADWTYYSAQHYYESSAGTWMVSVSDEEPLDTGSVLEADLIIDGVAINDTDHDGLEDGWEMAHFGSLAFGPKDDPDGDGYNNAVEQIAGTDPNVIDPEFRVDLSRWNERLVRVSWPTSTNHTFQLYGAADAAASFNLITNVTGKFPETEWFTPCSNAVDQFFRVSQ